MNSLKNNLLYVPCPFCGRENPGEIYNEKGRRIVRCNECGFMYQNPRKQTLIGREYQVDYYKQEYLETAVSHKKLFEVKFNEFFSNRKPGMILDVGCATGQFLEVAEARGWRPVGIDVSEWVCNYLMNRGFTDIHHGTLEEADFPDEIFDVIHMNHVLEHIPLPCKFLAEAYRILKPEGQILIEVPNEFYFPYNYKLMNLLMPSHRPPRQTPVSHLNLFTRKSLLKILKSSGFSSVHIRSEGFANKYRRSTPAFKTKTWITRAALLMCQLRLDTFLGLGRYLVALARKQADTVST